MASSEMSYRGSWQQASSRVVYSNPWFSVVEDKVVRPDGAEGIYGYIDLPKSVMIIALNEKKEFPLILRSSYPRNGAIEWSLPGGGVERDEHETQAAMRELREETGLGCTAIQNIGQTVTYSGISNEIQYTYVATSTSGMATVSPTDDFIQEIKFVSIMEAEEMILKGTLSDGQSITGIALASLRNCF